MAVKTLEEIYTLRDKSTKELLEVTDDLYVNSEVKLAYEIARVRILRLQFLLHSILTDLPANRDWLDPHLEAEIRNTDA